MLKLKTAEHDRLRNDLAAALAGLQILAKKEVINNKPASGFVNRLNEVL